MHQALGAAIAITAGSGFPLTQLAIARLGRPGAAVVCAVTAGMLVVDIASIVTSDAAAEGRGQEALLYAETAVAALATAANLALASEQGLAAARSREWRVGWVELVRRISLGAMFGMHSARYRSYLGIPVPSGRQPAGA